MTTRREIRLAQVEYQPNLHHPVAPIPLGLVVEELHGSEWKLVVVGRRPRGDVPGMQLENTWGPFRNVVTGWGDLMLKNARELMEPADAHGPVLDKLTQQWNLNVYLRQPENKVIRSSLDLVTYAKRCCAQYLKPPASSKKKKPRRKAGKATRRISNVTPNRQRSWLSISNQLQAVA
jgi:hypothetical protein